MKGRKILIIGSLVVAGVIIYEIFKHFYGEKKEDPENVICSEQDTTSVADAFVAPVPEIYTEKEAAISSLKQSHNEVSKVMKESLSTIFNENQDGDIVTKHSETLDKTRIDLEDLLK